MEELRSSRAGARRMPNGGARPGYDDVFGGPPRYAAPPLDYAEIFGGLASSCSIPFLDLPPVLDEDPAAELSGAGGFDYAEIFAGFGDGGSGPSYEELVAEPKAPEIVPEGERAPEETVFSQNVVEATRKPPDVLYGDHMACLDEDKFLSNSDHSDDGSKQFTMSFHKTIRGSMEDTVNGTTKIAQLHTVPGFTVVIDACSPLHNEVGGNPSSKIDHGLKTDLNGAATDRKLEVLPSTSSGGCTQSSAVGQEDHKTLSTNDHAAEDVCVNAKQHSRSSSYHSTSSGDISYTDATYVTVSDISLRTRPLQVPPPSRPPPRLGNKKENPVTRTHASSKADVDDTSLFRPVVNYQTQFGGSVSRKHSFQNNAKDNPNFYDVEVDATSDAAASVAAMKEAMEQAQASLKSAKELLEKKRENAQNRKKHGHHDGMKHKERQEDNPAQEVRDLSEEMVWKTLVDKDQRTVFPANGWQEAKPEVATDHEEKERHAAEEIQQTIQRKEVKSSHILYNLDEGSGEWKKDKQFYELINNDKRFRTVKEVSEQEGSEKKSKAIEKSNGDKENETKMAKRNRKLWEINDARECEVKDKILKAGNMASSEKEIKEIPRSIPDLNGLKENVNRLDATCASWKQEKSKEKIKLAQEDNVVKEEEAKTVVGEEASACGNSTKKLEPSNDDFKHEKDRRGEEEERRHNICEKELNGSYKNCEPQEGEMKLKQANKSGIQDADKKDIREPNGSGVPEAAEKSEATQATSQYETLEKTTGAAELECCTHEHINNLKGTAAALDQEEGKTLNGTMEECKWVENEKKLEADEETYEVAGTMKKLEVSDEASEQTENENTGEIVKEYLQNHDERKVKEITAEVEQNEMKKDAVQVIFEPPQDHNERKANETPGKAEENEKEQDTVQVVCDLEGSERMFTGPEGDCVDEEDEKNQEVELSNELEKECSGLNGAKEHCQSAAKEDLEALQQDCLLRKKRDVLATSEDSTETQATVSNEKTILDSQVEEKERERRTDREREQEKEQVRRLEEEREREREREKDRLAIERATREAHERALAEARERAERIVVERVTAEARQRALAEAREKAEKAEKASREARLKAERAAVERATAEARERAAERILAEKAASDARERAERSNATSRDRMRKDCESGECFRGNTKEDSGTGMKDVPCAEQYQSVGSSSSFQTDSHNNVSAEKFEGAQTESALRCKARLERHQRTVQRAARALAEKNLRDILAQREQAERNRMAESLDAEIRRWSSGKEGNLRALLSTLQYILGPESGWQPIPLTDVITAAAVKKAYRKATLCVHPDKLQQRGASIQQKYICEKVFDLLKEAWNRFNSEER